MEKRYPSCILATCCLPWTEGENLDEGLFRRAIGFIASHTPHIYVMGTAGGGYGVSERQFTDVVRIFAQTMDEAKASSMVGSSALPSEVLERIEIARSFGVREFQVSLPSWGPCSESELYAFFDAVCGSHPDCLFLNYNLLRTKRFITPKEYGRIAADHENFVGAKVAIDSTRQIWEFLYEAPSLRYFFTEPGFAYGSLIGDCGLLISSASCNWRRAEEYYRAGKERDTAALLSLQAALLPHPDLISCVGSSAHMDGPTISCS
jgi:dihydrodipicolinate synthase/N-acetylneuraminate lyase